MSIAWATVALLVLLLPGFLFFVGIYIPERFTRETVPANPLGQLAAAVLVAVGVHGVFYAIFAGHIDTHVVFATLQLQGADELPLPELAERLEASRGRLFAYVIATCAVGLGTGAGFGQLSTHGRFRRFVQHPWVYELQTPRGRGHIYAYVMTHIRAGERVLTADRWSNSR